MDYIEFAEYHKLSFRENYIDSTLGYKEIFHWDSGELAARYYYDEYDYLSCFISASGISKLKMECRFKVIFKTAINLTHLNVDKGFSILSEYVDKLCEEVFDGSGMSMDRKVLNEVIQDTLHGKTEIITGKAKYEWVCYLTLKEKRRLIGEYNGKTIRMTNFGMVENALVILCSDDFEGFITSEEIVSEAEKIHGEDAISERTVRRTLNDSLKDIITEHNLERHGTDNFRMYMKFCNVHDIAGAIDAITEMNALLTKVKVAQYSSVHRNTVNNLWEEDKIREALNNYNKAIAV